MLAKSVFAGKDPNAFAWADCARSAAGKAEIADARKATTFYVWHLIDLVFSTTVQALDEGLNFAKPCST
jgi:hypothetical protein